jgi:ergothioneine biosynthesis protein EgtB
MRQSTDDPSALPQRYAQVRAQTLALVAHLPAEDQAIQSAPCASPAKWHLAHTTWFFEKFLLQTRPGYRPFDERYAQLFNSYYESVGTPHPRAERGLLSRPTVGAIVDYRRYVDERIERLLARSPEPRVTGLIVLGLNHEQQHQELILTDLKHLYSVNPLQPHYMEGTAVVAACTAAPQQWCREHGRIAQVGAFAEGFAFDNERPRHLAIVADFEIASRVVTNGEFLDFVRDGGYRHSALWLADGWEWLNRESVDRPLYWSRGLDTEFTLAGTRELDPAAPVCHVSYYEADAFARWAGARLPTEVEWEVVAEAQPVEGIFLDSGLLQPQPTARATLGVPGQLFGDVWEWTASPYVAYPGFRPLGGPLGEYNGKFMSSQMVCRGGSCATPAGHVRPSYRNFFYPAQRWQFLGIRLARDC